MNYPKSSFFALVAIGVVAALCLAPSSVVAQQSAGVVSISPVKTGVVPSLVSYSGVLKDASGRTVTSITGVTFLLYQDSQGGAPLWMETQNVTPDETGHYTVQLGSTTSAGLPPDMFMSGEARWLALQVSGEAEQPRVLLVAVPYAMKAADAETVGGLPPSAFVLAAPPTQGSAGSSADSATASASSSSSSVPPAANVTTSGGTVNTIPLFTTATSIGNSLLTQSGTGTVNVLGRLNLPAKGLATAAAGKNSQPQDMVASSFNSFTNAAVAQTFLWQAEPVGNNTKGPSGTLNLLFGSGTSAPAETGLNINNLGLFTFAPGQTFPGTVTSVGLSAPASDFLVTGSPVTSSGTLQLTWLTPPTSLDTGNAIVKRDAFGNFSAGVVNATQVIASDSAPGAATIVGYSNATTGASWGVYGTTNSSATNAYGVVGYAAAPTGHPNGVYGVATGSQGVGVFGQTGSSESTLGTAFASNDNGVGLWGDGGPGGSSVINVGVLGSVDEGTAGTFANNSSSGLYDTLDVFSYGSSPVVFYVSSFNFSKCYVDINGNLNCTGAKNAVVPVDGGKRTVAMSAIESPQNWFEDFGSARLVHGVAVVKLDPDFIQTANTDTNYKVFPVPNGDCKGLYVTNKTANSFEVRELGGGTSNIGFDYRITVLRRNYETVRFADHTHDLDGHNRMMALREAAKTKKATSDVAGLGH